ncbi:MAG TPA: serine/threonine-protein kinase [Polyangia bacterium]|jgi:serine/threonine protein kinase
MTRVGRDDRTRSSGGRGGGRTPFDQRLTDGELVARRYRVVRLIGAGAVGEVYEATDEVVGEAVALKTLRAGVADDAVSIERFRREIQVARRVTHRNVCRTFDVGHHASPDGTTLTFITMELLRGPTLADVLESRGRFSADEALPLAEQMGAGLAAAHAVGVIHRDFKPGNLVLVDEAGGPRVVITDFGLARRYAVDETSITVTGEAVGTPLYMAPEQVVTGQKPVTPATDVYALGIVLYEMVTGELPFKGSSITVMAIKRFREAVPPPRLIVPGLDARWDATILRCLEREPERRFPRVLDVMEALVGNGPPPDSRPEGGPARGFFRRSSRRR